MKICIKNIFLVYINSEMGLKTTVKKAYMKAKKKAYGSKGVKGRYVRPGFTKGMGNLIKDVEMIKSRLNVEKKHKDRDVVTYEVGQVSANTDGVFFADVTPNISQGTDSDERIGNSLKLTGMTLPMSFVGQSLCLGDRKFRVSLLKVMAADNDVTALETVNQVWDPNPLNGMTLPMSFVGQSLCLGDRKFRVSLLKVMAADNDVTALETVNQVWDPNPLNGLRDFNAPRKYRNSKTDGISVIRSKVYTLKAPQLDNGSVGTADYERNVLTIRFNVKFNDLLRYDNSADNYPQGIRYILVIQANAGNYSTSTASTLDLPVKEVSSGVEVRVAQRNWWVDN